MKAATKLFAALRLGACGLSLFAAVAAGEAIDEALVARFEAASAPGDQQRIADEIRQRLDDGPLAEGLKERLIMVLASRPSLGHSRYTTTLEALGAPQRLSAASINAIAAGLVTDGITHDWSAYQSIRKILSAYQRVHGLPHEAYSSLKHSLRSERPYWMVIEVLAGMAADDPRHDDALAAIVDALDGHAHHGIRSAAIAGIERMSAGGALSQRALSTLQDVALSDEYISVRLDAIELLSKQELDPQRKQLIGASVAAELTTPTPGLWQRSPSRYSRADNLRRAIELLVKLHDRPYPDRVLDALIVQSRSFAAERTIELLRANRPAGGFSDAQRQMLEGVAAQHHNEAMRAELFKLVAPQTNANSMQNLLGAFENAKGKTARIAAGHALLNHYDAGAVPVAVVEVAAGMLRESKDPKVQHVAASLIARGDEAFSSREQRLLAGLEAHPFGANVYDAFVELYGKNGFDDLVVRYIADPSVPIWFRAHLIRELRQPTAPGAMLPDEVEAALLRAGRSSSDYQIISAVLSALSAWRIEIPIAIYLKARTTHSRFLFGLLVLCALINLIVCLLVLVKVLTARLREGARVLKRTLLALGWSALSLGMLALLAFAVFGFLGHNSAPDPRGTLRFQIPMYIGTALYLIVAWALVRFAKNRQAPAA